MSVTFTFSPLDVTNADSEHGEYAVHDQTQFTENGVTFQYSSDVTSGLGTQFLITGPGGVNELINTPVYLGPLAGGIGSPGEGELVITADDPENAFLENLMINVTVDGPGGLAGNIVFQQVSENGDVLLEATPIVFFGNFDGDILAEFQGQPFEVNKITFAAFGDNSLIINSITATPTCVLEGTCFTRADGAPVTVEDLRPGDRIRTETGITTVKWIGRQFIDTRLTHPARVNPICISAGALGDGLPARDVRVSADHAIGIDGILVNAGALVNGSSICRVAHMPREGFTYYHVETEAHELLLSEGIGVESFIDYVGRDSFDNAPPALPARIAEMPRPRVSAARMLPDALRARLEAQAQALTRAKAA